MNSDQAPIEVDEALKNAGLFHAILKSLKGFQ
jgi:hypothetical protein